jgi:spoIIIJ-associated protein
MEPNRDPPPPRHAPEKVAAARRFCEELLQRLGAKASVEVRESDEAVQVCVKPLEGNKVELNAAFVEAAQTLVNRVANPRSEGRKWVNLEVGGFADDGDPAVEAMAARLAATVVRTGKTVAISPMSPRERRQLHLALAAIDGVATMSEGEGIFRRLLVYPDAAKKAAAPRE